MRPLLLRRKSNQTYIMKTQVFILFFLFLLSWLIIGCKKSDDEPEIKAELPKVSIGVLGNITTSDVSVEVAVTDDGGADITARGVCFSTSTGPTINDGKTTEGTGKGTFMCTVTGLTPSTRYYIRAYATNSKGTGYSGELDFLTTFESVADYEGNVYQAVKIGEQIWTSENLNPPNMQMVLSLMAYIRPEAMKQMCLSLAGGMIGTPLCMVLRAVMPIQVWCRVFVRMDIMFPVILNGSSLRYSWVCPWRKRSQKAIGEMSPAN
jgi:hypothetical protein